VVANQKGFYWKADSLTKLQGNVKVFDATLDRAVTAAVDYSAVRAEAYMKRTARWTDRTGNARSGLFATTQHVPKKLHRIILGHGVEYGIWLEVRFAGRYAVIPQTLQTQGNDLMRLLNGLLGGLGR
jgi:hypothetical protein